MSTDRSRAPRDIDWVMLGATVLLALIGVAFVHSASPPGDGLSANATRQLVYVLVSLGAMAIILRFDHRVLSDLAPWAWAASLVLLAAVLVFGVEKGGARAWLRLGSFSLQPSELAKFTTVLLLANIAGRRPPNLAARRRDVLAMLVAVGVPVVLIKLQPDDGTVAVFAALLGVVVFVSGLRWRFIIAGAVALTLLAPVAWKSLAPHQRDRILVVVQPGLDPAGRGYQSNQSRITVGSGGVFGRGYGEGPQNRLGFLPERHTDFIFAIIAEETGFAGCIVVLGLYLVLLRRIADAAILAPDRVGRIICVGSLVVIAVHVMVNVGMALGLLPIIGIPLPLVSFGGTSLLSTTSLVALAASVRLRRFQR